MKSFRILIVLVMAAAIGLPAYAEVQSEKTREALRQEFEWLRAEAAATVTIATKTKMNIDDAPSIVSVITEEQIKNSGAKNLSEVLRQVSGFHINSYSAFPDTKVGIRGLSEEVNPGVKIMVNGHSVENVLNDNSGYVPSFPIGLIKKIEIIRGPGSALYGNEAMNGVISIITKDAKDPSAISAGYGSFGTYSGTGQLSYSKDDLNLFLFVDHISGDGDPQLIGKDAASVMFPPGFGNAPGYSNEESGYDNVFAKLSYKDFRLTASYVKAKAENPVGITGTLTDKNDVRYEKAFAEAAFERALTEKIRLNVKAYYDYDYDDFSYEMFGARTSSLFGFPKGESVFARIRTKTDKFGADIMTDIDVADSLKMVAGVMSEYSMLYVAKTDANINLTGQTISLDGIPYMPMQYLGAMREQPYETMETGTRAVYAGYVQGTWNIMKAFPSFENIGKNLTLTAGVRDDYYSDSGGTVNPRMGIVYAPNDRLFFKLLYGQAFRAPVYIQMNVKNNATIFGNPDLKPEIVKTSEIQAGVNLTDRITATLNFFNVRKEDAIVLYKGHYENRGEIESQGVEGEIRVSFDKHKYSYFNVTFQKAKDITHDTITDLGGTYYAQEDFDLGSYPQVMANLGVNSDISRYINANVSVNYIGSMERIGKMQFTASETDPDGTVQKTDLRDPVNSYALFNMSLIFHNFDFAKGWELQLTGYNLFNADQRDPDISGQVPDDLPRWGRNFIGKLTYTF